MSTWIRQLLRQQQFRQCQHESRRRSSKRFAIAQLWRVVGFLLVVTAASLFMLWIWLMLLDRDRWLGKGPTLQGGLLGRKIDNSIKRYLFYWRDWSHRRSVRHKLASYKTRLFSSNITTRAYEEYRYNDLPACPEASANRMGVPVLLNPYLEETLLRGMERRLLQSNATHQCPFCLHFPLVGDWYQPSSQATLSQQHKDETSSSKIQSIPYQESEIESWMLHHFGDDDNYRNFKSRFYHIYQGWSRLEDRIQLWGLLAVYLHGGIFRRPRSSDGDEDLIKFPDTSYSNFSLRFQENDKDSVNNNTRHSQPPTIQVIAAVEPRHAILECLLQAIPDDTYRNTVETTYPSLQHCSKTSWTDVIHRLERINYFCFRDHPLDGDSPPPPCDCTRVNGMIEQEATSGSLPSSLSLEQQQQNHIEQRPRFQVEISESNPPTGAATTATSTMTSTKDPQSDQLRRRRNCSAGWFCNRCLKLPWRGSFASCSSFCRSCYIDQICSQTTRSSGDKDDSIIIHVNVIEDSNSSSTQKRIPRIIHQTWLEELTAETYPHLHRLQNSWKAQTFHGWEYRFFTDEAMREYIVEHYSPASRLFLDAYDALIPGAFRADFFRLLVLFKHGGIYADIDLQLDVPHLDYLISRNLGYFVPRDVAIDRWPASNFCLWNGLQGAAPGHPILARAIQDVMNNILNRRDYYDLESEHCQMQNESRDDGDEGGRNLDAEIWKLRSFPLLLLTGPCALGVSVHTAIGRHDNRLQGFNVGWLVPNKTSGSISQRMAEDAGDRGSPPAVVASDLMGDVLILLTDRYDLGELRFTDVDRNLLIASSNADKFSSSRLGDANKSSSSQRGTDEEKKEYVHYSKFEDDIVGSQGIYKDDQVLNRRIRLEITHSRV